MAGKKTIIPSIVFVMTVCFLISSMAFAEGSQQNDNEYAPGFYYTVQKGDTLWGLSKKFYGSEWEWPAMWGQNEQLTNPHELRPGQKIRLHQRTEAIVGPEGDEAEGLEPESSRPEGPPVVATAGDIGSASLTKPVYFLYPGIAFIDFIKKLPPPTGMIKKVLNDPLAAGTIIKAVGSKKTMISQNDTIYIKSITGDYVIGELFSVYKPLIKIKDPDTDEYVGYQYRIIATAEVTSVEPQYVMAKITKALDTISSECLVMPQEKRSKEIPIVPSPEGLSGKVLLAQDHIKMSSDYTIVFLNKGKKDGVKIGQRYEVYHQDSYERNKQKINLAESVYGKLLVLVTENTTSTAIVTKSTEPIRKGALFRSVL